jgi:DNA modification methylase
MERTDEVTECKKIDVFGDGRCVLIQADVVEGLRGLPPESVHCIITSPPYYGLRDYGTAAWEGGDAKCDHANPTKGRFCPKCGARRIDAQLGLEATPAAYVEKMVEVFREVRRVLREDGTLWLNMGDGYASTGRSDRKESPGVGATQAMKAPGRKVIWKSGGGSNFSWELPGGLKPKDLCMMPARLAMALQADGWWLRAALPWIKRNAMPESTRDRPTSVVEYVLLLTKSARYFYDAEAVKVQGAGVSGGACFGKQSGDPAQTLAQQRRYNRPEYTTRARRASDWFFESWQGLYDEGDGPLAFIVNPAPFDAEFCTACERYFTGSGKKAIRIEKYTEDGRDKIRRWCPCGRHDAWVSHFATFPPGLVKPCIKAGTSQKGCCPKCGAPWRRVVERKGGTTGKSWHDHKADSEQGMRQGSNLGGAGNATDRDGDGYSTRTLGWSPTCACGLEPAPCTVLDPFGGAGTVSLVAEGLGRRSIYIDLNANYLKMAAERIKKDARLLTARSDASDDGEMPLLAGLDEPIKETARGRDKRMLGSARA